MKKKKCIGKLLLISTVLLGITSCTTRYYKQDVIPTGNSELTRKQIRRDFTN